MSSITFLKPSELGEEIQLDQPIITFGNSPENTFQIDRPTMASVHATIMYDGKGYILIDHSGKYGTYVNEIRIDRKRLSPGDRIRLGSHVEFIYGASEHESRMSLDEQTTVTKDRDEVEISDVQKKITLEEAGFEHYQKTPGKSIGSETQGTYLSAIYQVNQVATETFDLIELCSRVLELIFEIFPFDRVAVILSEPGNEDMRPVAFRVKNKSCELDPINISRTVVKQAISEKSAILAYDTSFDKRFREVSSIIRYKIRSVVCVPLHTKGKILGVLYADSIGTPGDFSNEDLRLLLAVGGAVANSIENVLLVDKIKEEERKLGTLERYLPSAVVKHVFGQPGSAELGGETCFNICAIC